MDKVCLERSKCPLIRIFILNVQASLSTETGISTKEHSEMVVNAAKVRD